MTDIQPSIVHLALGDSAAGSLRVACKSHGLPGAVFISIQDDLSHGPLVDGYERISYMRDCYRGYDNWTLDIIDAFVPWKKFIEWLGREKPEAVVIWSGDNVSEATFLAMACWQLKKRPEPVLRVAIPGQDDPPYVALHQPVELAGLYAGRQVIVDTDRALLSDDFVRIRNETGLLRRWEHGRIIGVPEDHYDHLLMASCETDRPHGRQIHAGSGHSKD